MVNGEFKLVKAEKFLIGTNVLFGHRKIEAEKARCLDLFGIEYPIERPIDDTDYGDKFEEDLVR